MQRDVRDEYRWLLNYCKTGAVPQYMHQQSVSWDQGLWKTYERLLSVLPFSLEGKVVLDFGCKYGHLLPLLVCKGVREVIGLGFIVMKQNENELGDFFDTCKALGVKGTRISPCVRTPEQGKKFLPSSERLWLYDRDAFERTGQLAVRRLLPWNRCPWLYCAITIQSDGNEVPCCHDARGEHVMGHILTQSLGRVWNGPEFTRWRHSFRRREKPPSLCSLCPGEGSPELR